VRPDAEYPCELRNVVVLVLGDVVDVDAYVVGSAHLRGPARSIDVKALLVRLEGA